MTKLLSWTLGALATGFWSILSLCTQSSASAFADSLSSKAEIYYPGSEQFIIASKRWNAALTPSFHAIVKVANEDDVQKTVSASILIIWWRRNLSLADPIRKRTAQAFSGHIGRPWNVNYYFECQTRYRHPLA